MAEQQTHKKRYMKGKDAAEYLGISQSTLRRYDRTGKIQVVRTPGNQRLYDVSTMNTKTETSTTESKKVCYCRVSTHGQKSDLEHQVAFMKSKYPTYEIITDVGSGINFKRPGLIKIINYAIDGVLDTLVIAYKDRLCRIGYDLIEHILTTYSSTKIIVNEDKAETINEEIANDILQIINVYSAKINGMRKYKTNE